jgi:hypothetical protein
VLIAEEDREGASEMDEAASQETTGGETYELEPLPSDGDIAEPSPTWGDNPGYEALLYGN